MPPRNEDVRLRAETERQERAIRNLERAMEDEERELERAMSAFEEDADQAKRHIEGELREEHGGHDPPRPPAWAEDHSNTSSHTRRPRRSK